MHNYSFFDSINHQNKSYFLQIADQCLLPVRVACNRQSIDLQKSDQTKFKTYHIGLRILAALAAVCVLPMTLMALAIKWWKKEEWQRIAAKDFKSKNTVIQNGGIKEKDGAEFKFKKVVAVPGEQGKCAEFIKNELALIQDLEPKLAPPMPGSWRKYGEKHGESNVTLEDYVQEQSNRDWPDHRPLHIQKIGQFSDIDLKIIAITCDYLQIFHNLPIKISQNILTMDQLRNDHLKMLEKKQQKICETTEEQEKLNVSISRDKFTQLRLVGAFPRENGQYNGSVVLDLMKRVLGSQFKSDSEKKAQIMAFTSEDLYTETLSNFVFGCASLVDDVGIWSNSRFGDPSSSPKAFQTCLLRMMKLSTHEFGHMRGLSHCTDYECNIGGYMSMTELDSRPLLYCPQDMAKICYLTQTSLLEHHQKILDFFQKFNETYQLNVDFSKEIQTLKKRIALL